MRHAKCGQIQFATVPDLSWDEITMDFIVKLPASRNPATREVYNAIMVIVNKFTKYELFILFKESYIAE